MDDATATLSQPSVSCGQDEMILRRSRFNHVAASHWDGLFRFAYWLTNNRQIAEDLVQETLLRAWKAYDSLKDQGAVKGWLFAILRHENARRFEHDQPESTSISVEALADSRVGYDKSTEAFVLRRALSMLPVELRKPLLMQIVEGYSLSEIAHELGISFSGAGTRLFRARKLLRELVGDLD